MSPYMADLSGSNRRGWRGSEAPSSGNPALGPSSFAPAGPGALIAVPMTVLVTVIFAEIPALRPIALFPSNERDLAALEKQVAGGQR